MGQALLDCLLSNLCARLFAPWTIPTRRKQAMAVTLKIARNIKRYREPEKMRCPVARRGMAVDHGRTAWQFSHSGHFGVTAAPIESGSNFDRCTTAH
ncbi:MAG: hypothetical protein EOO80_05355 [Oxalobacteraceae bacterium]|nr:MAG: hypothetical protein EOO80_05355 [Oxalobacteraceae bacterium]